LLLYRAVLFCTSVVATFTAHNFFLFVDCCYAQQAVEGAQAEERKGKTRQETGWCGKARHEGTSEEVNSRIAFIFVNTCSTT